MIEKKQLDLKLSTLEADGTFTGMLSAYGNVDGGNDMVLRGAYTKTIQESGGRLVMCWQHDQKDPIGAFTMEDSSDGLMVKGKLNLDESVPSARRAYSMMKFLHDFGLKMGLSIGYEVIKREFKNGVRHLQELKLREGSLVTIPMNSATWVNAVKATEGAKDFASALEAIQMWATKYQMLQALSEALDQVFYGPSSRDEMLADIQTILSQFVERYTAWAPALLDLWGVKDIAGDWKAGRVLSAANLDQLDKAISALQALRASGTSPKEEAAKSAPPRAAAVPVEPGSNLHSALELLSKFSFREI